MKIRTLVIGGCLLACASPLAYLSFAGAQTSIDRSFTATARDCSSVRWSAAALRTYPSIAAACQSVQQRDGKSYVKFEGTLTRNIDRGKQLKVKFKGADEMTLTPPAEVGVYVNGQKVPVADLQRGDNLTFYVAEDRLAAQFYPENESPATTTQYVLVPIFYSEQVAAVLPATGSTLPLIGIGSLCLIAVAAALCIRRMFPYYEE